MSIIQALAVALALSLAANGWLFHQRDKAISQMATAEQLNKDTMTAASSCTASVDRLASDGIARQKRIEAAMAAVAPRVRQEQEAANIAARARPDNAGDLCGSLQRYLQQVIKAEKAAP